MAYVVVLVVFSVAIMVGYNTGLAIGYGEGAVAMFHQLTGCTCEGDIMMEEDDQC